MLKSGPIAPKTNETRLSFPRNNAVANAHTETENIRAALKQKDGRTHNKKAGAPANT